MKTISLTNSDRVATVNDEFHLFLSRFTWCLSPDGKYACAYIAGTFMCMHQLILNSKNETDHIDHDGLHNELTNLRVATTSQNMANRAKFIGKPGRIFSSQYKGVSYNKRDAKFRAVIIKDRVKYELGGFKNEKRAARAYDEAAIRLFGSFAQLNFPHQPNNIKEIA